MSLGIGEKANTRVARAAMAGFVKALTIDLVVETKQYPLLDGRNALRRRTDRWQIVLAGIVPAILWCGWSSFTSISWLSGNLCPAATTVGSVHEGLLYGVASTTGQRRESLSRMETESPCVSEQRLCSVFARNAGDDPIGTASNYDLFLIMEMNLPWLGLWYEAKSASRELVDTLKRARERGVRARPLAIAPDPEYSQPGQTRVLVYRRPDSPFSRYEKEEFVVPEDRLVPLLEAYLNQLGSLGQFEEFRRQTQHIRELFVCTHGSVDVCCGTFGYPAYQILRNRYAGTELRVWRTSHFGGHAFAPTLFDMPEGRWWGHLDPEHLKALVHRSEAVSSLRQCYRGWGGLSFFGQVAEREIFIREGWGWSSLLKSETILNVTGGEPLDPGQSPRYASNPPVSARVRIDFTSPDGAVSGAYEATIELKGQVFTMGSTGDQKLLRANQYHVTSLERL